jgi:hypothetical protein
MSFLRGHMMKLTFQYIFLFLRKAKKQLLFCLLFILPPVFIGCDNKITDIFIALGIVVGLFFAAFSDAVRNPDNDPYIKKITNKYKEVLKIFEKEGVS